MKHTTSIHHSTLIIGLNLFLTSASLLFGASEPQKHTPEENRTQSLPIPIPRSSAGLYRSFQNMKPERFPDSLQLDMIIDAGRSPYPATLAYSWEEVVRLLGEINDCNERRKSNHKEENKKQESDILIDTNEDEEFLATDIDENKKLLEPESPIDRLSRKFSNASPKQLFNEKYQLWLLKELAQAVRSMQSQQ